MKPPVTRVLVVEDSAVLREFLIHALESDADIKVVGVAANGIEALDAVRDLRPDVVTMDVQMPKMDGLEATRRIMETHPTPIVIVSGSAPPTEVARTFATMDAGALAIMARPRGLGHEDHEATVKELIRTVKLMAEVKVVRRWARRGAPTAKGATETVTPQSTPGPRARAEIVVLGASTGGPPVLRTILGGLDSALPVPILIVQHISDGFIKGFADWLSAASGYPVSVAAHGERPLPGRAYVAPDGRHLQIASNGTMVLSSAPLENGHRPSVSSLFRSVAAVHGPATVAGLLTGMGRDGANELKRLKEVGALTFVQDMVSSVVHGMPGEAIRLGAAEFVLPPEKMAAVLIKSTTRSIERGQRQ
jgi:two-component system chemotaxis response regulator CheB